MTVSQGRAAAVLSAWTRNHAVVPLTVPNRRVPFKTSFTTDFGAVDLPSSTAAAFDADLRMLVWDTAALATAKPSGTLL